jgi:hypothetical protein
VLGADPGPHFDPKEAAPPPVGAAELDAGDDYIAPPLPEEWTPERAENIVRAAGLVLHFSDGYGRRPGGEELWRATDADARDMAGPLARILNRYTVLRTLAKVSDGTELGAALYGYARRNLGLRGRLVADYAEAEPAALFEGAEQAPSGTGEVVGGPWRGPAAGGIGTLPPPPAQGV